MIEPKIEYENGKTGHLDRRLGGNLSMEVKAYGGSHCHECIRDMPALANRIRIDIWSSLNGVRTLVRPGDDPEATISAWEGAFSKAANSPWPRIASAGR